MLFDDGLPHFYSNSIVTLKDGTIHYCENEVSDIQEQKKSGSPKVILILSDQNGEKKYVYSSEIVHIEYSD